jgi:hypothetical protein
VLLGQAGKFRNSPCGLRHLNFFFRLALRCSTPPTGPPKANASRRLVWLRQTSRRSVPIQQPGRCAASRGVLALRAPLRRAEQRSGRRKEKRSCLSPQGEFCASRLPRAAQGSPGTPGPRNRGRLSFGDFSLAKQRKVTALSGAHPDAVQRNATMLKHDQTHYRGLTTVTSASPLPTPRSSGRYMSSANGAGTTNLPGVTTRST